MNMKEKFSSFAAMFSAFVMAGCCLGPLILLPLGLTGIAGTLSIFSTNYQPYVMVATFVLLGLSFYYVYGRQCKKKNSIITVWVTTVFVGSMFVYTLIVNGYI
jgi:mercuric ion transport protein